MNFGTMKMTHEKFGENDYRIRVGNDIIEVRTYFGSNGCFYSSILDHYIENRDNKPTNPRRTQVLKSYVDEYLERLRLKELEEDLRKVAALPMASCLKEDFKGKWLHFYAGMTAREVIRIFDDEYSKASIFTGGCSYDIYKRLPQKKEGFLSEELNEMFF